MEIDKLILELAKKHEVSKTHNGHVVAVTKRERYRRNVVAKVTIKPYDDVVAQCANYAEKTMEIACRELSDALRA